MRRSLLWFAGALLLFAAGTAGASEPEGAETPTRTGEPDVESVEAETRAIQQRVNQSKSAIDQLTQRVLENAQPSQLVIGEPRVAPGLDVASAQYLVDGVLVTRLDGAELAPGPHELVARLEVEGDMFLSAYAFRMQAQTELPTTADAVVRAAVVLELDDGRPAARFDVEVDE
jgi:hypothetical protein